MNEYSLITESLDCLSKAILESQNSYWPIVISTVLATIGSVITVFATDKIREVYFEPRREFRKIRRRVDSTLVMYACYYANPIDLNNLSPKVEERYKCASNALREMASELRAFADEVVENRTFCNVTRNDIMKASSEMIGLSNSLFYNSNNFLKDNDEKASKIRRLLRITEQ